MVLGYIIPVIGIICLYCLLVGKLRRATQRSERKRKSHKKVTKLVTIIIAVFIICWLPYWSFQLYFSVAHALKVGPTTTAVVAFKVSNALAYANSMINPVLYGFTNDQFKESFISAFHCVSDRMFSARRQSNADPTLEFRRLDKAPIVASPTTEADL